MLAAQLPGDARVRDVRSGPRPRAGDETTRQHGLERPGPRDRGRGSERPRGMDRTFPPRSLELARSPERLPRRSRPRRRRQVRRARDPPRGSSPRAGRPPEAPSRAARNRASSPTASPNEPAWRVANDPVLMETDGGDAHANQGVPREDAMMDEDGDEADDFLLAEDAPRSASAPEPEIDVVVHLTAPDAETLPPHADTLDDTPHDIRTCVTCGLDLEEQPDVPLPPDPEGERPARVVGRWLGRCERGCATALCGPCLTARATTVLQRATRRLEVIVSGLGTGYTMMDEDDAPDAPDARTPVVPCPRGEGGGDEGDADRGPLDGARRRRECGAALRGAPLTEAEDETHKLWASAATEALFAAAAARAFAPKDAVAPGGARATRPGTRRVARRRRRKLTIRIPSPRRFRFRRTRASRVVRTATAAPRWSSCPLRRRPRGGSWRSATPSRADGSPARLSNTSTRVGTDAVCAPRTFAETA